MKTSIRAYRVLSHLTNFKMFDPQAAGLLVSINSLGQPLGLYENALLPGNDVGVFSEGLACAKDGKIVCIPFSEIVSCSLMNGKKSNGISLFLSSGASAVLPVTGGSEGFSDSLEFLRFLDRVINDIKNMA